MTDAENKNQVNSTTVNVEKEAVANIKNFTTIPNSIAEFCIYTYKAEYETCDQISRNGFFNSAYSFLNVGDTIRVFRFDESKKLSHILEYVVVDVDKITKQVSVITTAQMINVFNRINKG